MEQFFYTKFTIISSREYKLPSKETDMINEKFYEIPMIQPDEIKYEVDIPVLFVSKIGNYEIAQKTAWKAITSLIKENKLENTKLRRFIIVYSYPEVAGKGNHRVDACVQENSRITTKEKVDQKNISGGKYAIFTCHSNSKKILETCDRIFFKWLPSCDKNLDIKRIYFMEYFDAITTKIYIPLL